MTDTYTLDETRASDSPLVEMVWRTQSERAGSFISQAIPRWEIVLSKYEGQTTLTVRGPETKATEADFPAGGDWLGISFKLGAFMPLLLPGTLMDNNSVNLPEASGQSFWLNGAAWEFPTFDNADEFVRRLQRDGLLRVEPLVHDVLQGHAPAFSPRAVQYRFLRATGLTQKTVQQIERARRAADLLANGLPPVETAYETGYFDQSHLTNALRRYLGQTPAQILRLNQPG